MSAAADEKETGRIEAFSDGVFAIAVTLLVLELRVPHLADRGADGSLGRALLAQWPSYVALATSFFTILVMWANHHRVFELVHRVDAPFLYANGLLLLVVTVVPFPTAILAEYFRKPGASVAAAVYAGTFVVAGIAFQLFWRTAISGRRLLKRNYSEERVQEISRRYWVGVPGYAAATIAAFVSVYLTVAICVALLVVWIAVSRSARA
ncbi:MAG TPA: TMEM175 family protein [Thermoanaerobaculia bacterium]|nr:TMEM175 family protein [Thermoanaerobaculia bacterium]